MKPQDAFNIAAKHLLTQMKKSQIEQDGDAPQCVYRHPDGVLMCGIGPLIPDGEYLPTFEGHSISWIADRLTTVDLREANIESPTRIPLGVGFSTRLLGTIQAVHDLTEPEQWRENLQKVATHYGLEWPNEL